MVRIRVEANVDGTGTAERWLTVKGVIVRTDQSGRVLPSVRSDGFADLNSLFTRFANVAGVSKVTITVEEIKDANS